MIILTIPSPRSQPTTLLEHFVRLHRTPPDYHASDYSTVLRQFLKEQQTYPAQKKQKSSAREYTTVVSLPGWAKQGSSLGGKKTIKTTTTRHSKDSRVARNDIVHRSIAA